MKRLMDFGSAENLPDGLYQVDKAWMCAGFVVHKNRVIECAPILHRAIVYWLTIAVRIGD